MPNYLFYRNAWRFAGSPHHEQKLQPEEYRSLLKHGGLLVRNTYDFDCEEETSFWYVIKDHFGNLEELKPRVRNKVRHALKTYDYRRIDSFVLKEKGYPIMAETYADYAISDRKMNQKVFLDYLDDCQENEFQYWGVFEKESDALVGFSLVRCWENCAEYDLSGMMSKYKHNATYPYYGLFHSMNRHYLHDCGFRYVSDGSRSITEHSQIHDYLIQNFHFRKAYCQLSVHYKWWMKIAVKLLYPFRKIIPLQRVKAILNMEAMQRGEK
ncbi:MAG: hypothetical protein IJQ11_05725 [Bacteroidales bacterium]|nr:hypothetical protein [Bacteroidales bacterium]